MADAEAAHEIVLEADQRRAIATALTSQVPVIWRSRRGHDDRCCQVKRRDLRVV
jgi:hypothetical protein